jgi:hypothetical protein
MASLRLSCVLALAVCGILSAAARASIIIPLTLTNTPGVPSNNVPYGTITLDAVELGPIQAVQFTVTSDVPGYFIDAFYFNSDLLNGDLRLASSSLTASTPTLNDKKGDFNVSEFGRYDFQFDTNGHSTFSLTTYTFTVAATSGGVDVSSAPDDFLVTNLSAPGGHMFAGHIKTTNNTSAFIAGDGFGDPPTPEPASLSVLGIGAALLLRRRRRVEAA